MMSRASRIGSTVVAGLAVSSLLASAPSQAAATSGWRIVLSKHYGQKTADSGYDAVVIPRPDDAWVFGGGCSCAAGHPEAEHWNGTRWSAAALPASLLSAAGTSGGVGGYYEAYDGVQHFNGKTWQQVSVPRSIGTERFVLAVSSRQVAVGAGQSYNQNASNAVIWAYGTVG